MAASQASMQYPHFRPFEHGVRKFPSAPMMSDKRALRSPRLFSRVGKISSASTDFRMLLETAACDQNRGVSIYSPGNLEECETISYAELRRAAHRSGAALQSTPDFTPHQPILIHFDNNLDNILWFWAAAYAGAIPAISTPFVMDPEGRRSHIQHMYSLLSNPLCLTSSALLERDFADSAPLRVTAVESLNVQIQSNTGLTSYPPRADGLALLMLTSGSTGSSKAVCLTHDNLLASVRGKSKALSIDAATSFFNFIGLDHVASLAETHLHALHSRVNQIHVQAADLISDPLQFIRLASKHTVGKVVMPNFFLTKLGAAIGSANALQNEQLHNIRLEFLKHVVSGGEACPLETVQRVSGMLHEKYGVPRNAIKPANGMTETCAGFTYNQCTPDHDQARWYSFCSVGPCMPGIRMRVSQHKDAVETAFSYDASGPHNSGSLELAGPAVFKKYYNNPQATANAFTPDGWFITGDEAFIDDKGHCVLTGRTKDMISINGVKHLPHEIETAVEISRVPGVAPGHTVCFPYRLSGDPTERIYVVYLPSYSMDDAETRFKAREGIKRVVRLHTGTSPYVLPLDASQLRKSDLGKVSRNKIRTALDAGAYASYEKADANALEAYRQATHAPPATRTEKTVLKIVNEVLALSEGELGVEASLFERGVNSMSLIQLKKKVERAFSIEPELPMMLFMTNSTVRALSRAVETQPSIRPPLATLTINNAAPTPAYDPLVSLSTAGAKTNTRLFLLHPGVGEILVFLPLAQNLRTQRPLYALRAQGLDAPHAPPPTLDAVLDAYEAAIRRAQPQGPYALAGYSFGSMLAFELAKRLEAGGQRVAFVGALNLPPHIRWRMRMLDWAACLAHLALFLRLVPEAALQGLEATLRRLEHADAIAHVFGVADAVRAAELGLGAAALRRRADTAFALQSAAVDYEPSGLVDCLDVFYCQPLAMLGLTVEEWRARELEPWKGFVRGGDVRFHRVSGTHYTMLDPENVGGFVRVFEAAMRARGV